MSIAIDCDKKEILHIKNSLFCSLHEGMRAVIKEEKLKVSGKFQDLLDKMDQNIYGPGGVYGVDIADYLKTKQDALLFADLIKKGIAKENTIEYPFSDEALKCLLDFHKEVIAYAEELKNNK